MVGSSFSAAAGDPIFLRLAQATSCPHCGGSAVMVHPVTIEGFRNILQQVSCIQSRNAAISPPPLTVPPL